MNKNKQAFTLIELIITLAISTILMSIAVPSLASIYAYIRADTNIRKSQQSIHLARNHAIAYGIRVTVCPLSGKKCSPDWQKNISVFSDSGQKKVIDGNDKLLFTIGPFHSNDYVQYNRDAISFQSDGLASGTNGTFRYCPDTIDNVSSRAIIVSQSGRIRFSKAKNIKCD